MKIGEDKRKIERKIVTIFLTISFNISFREIRSNFNYMLLSRGLM